MSEAETRVDLGLDGPKSPDSSPIPVEGHLHQLKGQSLTGLLRFSSLYHEHMTHFSFSINTFDKIKYDIFLRVIVEWSRSWQET